MSANTSIDVLRVRSETCPNRLVPGAAESDHRHVVTFRGRQLSNLIGDQATTQAREKIRVCQISVRRASTISDSFDIRARLSPTRTW